MSRALAYLMLGMALAGLAAGVGMRELARPPAFISVLLAVAGGCALSVAVLHRARRRIGERRVFHALKPAPNGEALARRLLGDYPPYVVEAAGEVGAAHLSDAGPALMLAVERLMREQPPGWREMADAMAGALAKIGEGRALPLLRRLQTRRGAAEMENLEPALRALEQSARLLRPSGTESRPEERLVRPVGRDAVVSSSEVLLRPAPPPQADDDAP